MHPGEGRAEGSSRLGPLRTRPQEGAREAGLCPALQTKRFIYMASLQSRPTGRGQLQGTREAAQRKQRGTPARRVLSGQGQAGSKGTRPWASSPRAEIGPRGRRQCEVSSRGSGWGQHRCNSAHRTAGPLRRESKVCMGPTALPAPGPRPPLTIGVAVKAVLRGQDGDAGGGHRPSRTLCKVGHGGTCGDAQGRSQRVGGGAAVLRTRLRGARHGAEGGRLRLLRVALGKEGDGVCDLGAANHGLDVLLGRCGGHHKGQNTRGRPGAWLRAQGGLVHSDIADEDWEGHGGFRCLQGDLQGSVGWGKGMGSEGLAVSPLPPRPSRPAPSTCR